MPSVFGTVGVAALVVRESGVVKHGGAAELDFVGATVTKVGQKAVITITGGGGDTSFPNISPSDIDTIQEYLHSTGSTGLLSGNGLSDNGDGTVEVAAGLVLIRATNDDNGTLYAHNFSTVSSLALTDGQVNYIYLEYNGGSPQIVATTTERADDYNTNVFLGSVYRNGTDLHINGESEAYIASGIRRAIYRWRETNPFARASGGVLGETGTRNITVTEGVFWEGLTRFTTPAFDSSGSDTFVYVYRDGLGGWTEVPSQSQIDNAQYDDGSGTLATLLNNAFGVHWVYLENDGNIYVVFGQANYNNIAQAQDANPPATLPIHMRDHSRLLAKIIIREGEATFTEIQSAFDIDFAANPVTDHGDLAGLGDNDHPQYILHSELDQKLTYTKNLIEFNFTVEGGYTFSRFNPIIGDGNEIIIEDGGEFVVL